MSRDIKFRAWGIDEQSMFFVEELVFREDGVMFILTKNPKMCLRQDEAELMQYTGIKDKNGKEIYEGDIIDDEGWKAEIEFCEGKFVALNENDDGYLERLDLSDIAYSCKVIGNIHENKELLR